MLKSILPEGALNRSKTSITANEIKTIVRKLDDNELDHVGLKNINETINKSKSLSVSEKEELENLIKNEELNLKVK
jgi:protein-arginine kinase activator protein McsA